MGLSTGELARLWVEASGSPGHAQVAASVAWAESAGEPAMLGAGDRVGLWMPPVAADDGGPAMQLADPLTNATAAVELSSDGTDWTAFPGCERGMCRIDGTLMGD